MAPDSGSGDRGTLEGAAHARVSNSDIVTSAAILYVVAAGLLIVFGVMKIINFAHGGFLTMGGYSVLAVSNLGLNPLLAIPFSFVFGAVVGMAVERLVVRPLYSRPLDAILATWGLGIIIGQIITLIYDRGVQLVQNPIAGAVPVLGEEYSRYRLAMVAVATPFGALALIFTARVSVSSPAR